MPLKILLTESDSKKDSVSIGIIILMLASYFIPVLFCIAAALSTFSTKSSEPADFLILTCIAIVFIPLVQLLLAYLLQLQGKKPEDVYLPDGVRLEARIMLIFGALVLFFLLLSLAN
jgi:predicted permease